LAIALYPGSFDPVTKGHVDVAERAARLFEQLVVAVYDAPPKRLLFTVKERVKLMTKALNHLPNVRVTSFSGLTVEFAKEVKADVIVRGLRMSSDFEREFEMALMNKKLAPDLELICFMTNLEYEFISSSLLKEVCRLGGCIDDLVPEHVATALREKLRV
jgi:pantetheine-phosphate adenylyltransferase